MKAIDNSGALQLCASCCASGFAPAATYEYDVDTSTITITDTSTFPAGDDLTIMHIHITDTVGGKIYDKITVAGGDKDIVVSTLDAVGGFNILVTFVTDNRLIADASIYSVGSTAPDSGSVRYLNKGTC